MEFSKFIHTTILTSISSLGAWFIYILGGWNTSLETLLIFMAIDYITGILCALVWHNSSKSLDGTFESKSSVKGLLRKGEMLLVILIADRLDIEMNAGDRIRTAVILFFIVNEGLSIVENWGIMGLPMPDIIKNAFSIIKKNSQNKPNT